MIDEKTYQCIRISYVLTCPYVYAFYLSSPKLIVHVHMLLKVVKFQILKISICEQLTFISLINSSLPLSMHFTCQPLGWLYMFTWKRFPTRTQKLSNQILLIVYTNLNIVSLYCLFVSFYMRKICWREKVQTKHVMTYDTLSNEVGCI